PRERGRLTGIGGGDVFSNVTGSRRGAAGAAKGRGAGAASAGSAGASDLSGSGAVLSHGTRFPCPQSQKIIVPADAAGRQCVLPHCLQANQIMVVNSKTQIANHKQISMTKTQVPPNPCRIGRGRRV